VQSEAELRSQSFTELCRRLFEEASTLFRREMGGAKIELKSAAQAASVCAALLGIGAFLGAFSFLAVTAAIVLALATVLPGWAAALIVAAVYAMLASVFTVLGVARARRLQTPAQKTIRNLKAGIVEMEPTVEAITFKANLPARIRQSAGRAIRLFTYFRERVATKL